MNFIHQFIILYNFFLFHFIYSNHSNSGLVYNCEEKPTFLATNYQISNHKHKILIGNNTNVKFLKSKNHKPGVVDFFFGKIVLLKSNQEIYNLDKEYVDIILNNNENIERIMLSDNVVVDDKFLLSFVCKYNTHTLKTLVISHYYKLVENGENHENRYFVNVYEINLFIPTNTNKPSKPKNIFSKIHLDIDNSQKFDYTKFYDNNDNCEGTSLQDVDEFIFQKNKKIIPVNDENSTQYFELFDTIISSRNDANDNDIDEKVSSDIAVNADSNNDDYNDNAFIVNLNTHKISKRSASSSNTAKELLPKKNKNFEVDNKQKILEKFPRVLSNLEFLQDQFYNILSIAQKPINFDYMQSIFVIEKKIKKSLVDLCHEFFTIFKTHYSFSLITKNTDYPELQKLFDSFLSTHSTEIDELDTNLQKFNFDHIDNIYLNKTSLIGDLVFSQHMLIKTTNIVKKYFDFEIRRNVIQFYKHLYGYIMTTVDQFNEIVKEINLQIYNQTKNIKLIHEKKEVEKFKITNKAEASNFVNIINEVFSFLSLKSKNHDITKLQWPEFSKFIRENTYYKEENIINSDKLLYKILISLFQVYFRDRVYFYNLKNDVEFSMLFRINNPELNVVRDYLIKKSSYVKYMYSHANKNSFCNVDNFVNKFSMLDIGCINNIIGDSSNLHLIFDGDLSKFKILENYFTYSTEYPSNLFKNITMYNHLVMYFNYFKQNLLQRTTMTPDNYLNFNKNLNKLVLYFSKVEKYIQDLENESVQDVYTDQQMFNIPPEITMQFYIIKFIPQNSFIIDHTFPTYLTKVLSENTRVAYLFFAEIFEDIFSDDGNNEIMNNLYTASFYRYKEPLIILFKTMHDVIFYESQKMLNNAKSLINEKDIVLVENENNRNSLKYVLNENFTMCDEIIPVFKAYFLFVKHFALKKNVIKVEIINNIMYMIKSLNARKFTLIKNKNKNFNLKNIEKNFFDVVLVNFLNLFINNSLYFNKKINDDITKMHKIATDFLIAKNIEYYDVVSSKVPREYFTGNSDYFF